MNEQETIEDLLDTIKVLQNKVMRLEEHNYELQFQNNLLAGELAIDGL